MPGEITSARALSSMPSRKVIRDFRPIHDIFTTSGPACRDGGALSPEVYPMWFARLFPLITVTGLLASCGGDGGSIGPPGNDPSNVAPTAAFTAQCGPAEPLKCNFVNASTDTDGTIDIYAWDFGDNSAHVSTAYPTHVYTAPGGLFTVTLSVTDDDGETATASRQVDVKELNVPPTARFAASCTALTCAFTDGSSDVNFGDSVASHTWDFGDGGTSTEAN